jgi:hypothetical protein
VQTHTHISAYGGGVRTGLVVRLHQFPRFASAVRARSREARLVRRYPEGAILIELRPLIASHHTPTSGHEVEDQDHHSDNQQYVDQAAANVKAEAEKPENQHDHENCPKHMSPRSVANVPEAWLSLHGPGHIATLLNLMFSGQQTDQLIFRLLALYSWLSVSGWPIDSPSYFFN